MKSIKGIKSIRVLYYLVITIFITIILYVTMVLSSMRFANYRINSIPKVIWTYWHDPSNIPDVVQSCIKSWQVHNPDYKIIILNGDNIYSGSNPILSKPIKHDDSQARISDFVRLETLRKYGGVWMDASIICTKPLDDFILANTNTTQSNEFVGFYLPGFTSDMRYPVIESWFLAAPVGSRFIADWRDEFFEMENYDKVDDYVRKLSNDGIDFQKIDAPAYLAIHIAAQKVMQTASQPYNLKLLDATKGPYKYLVRYDWNSDEAVKHINDVESRGEAGIIKMRSTERNIVTRTSQELHY